MTETLLVATRNPGKLREIQEFLSGFRLCPVGLESYPHLEASPEEGKTFKENARQKAVHYSQVCSTLVVADDSGLVVDALGGAPGVHSARFVSHAATDEERYGEVLARMRNVPWPKRTARFVCCIALAKQGEILGVFDGVVEGKIAEEALGKNGFGYDPIFVLPKLGKTMAQLLTPEKMQVSHRGIALRQLAATLTKLELPIDP